MDGAPERMTIEQLAARSGMTVRNIREHQTRGLLPPPTLEGRRGLYDDEHLTRLQLIQRLQDEGLNLQAIGWLLDRAPTDASDEIARFERALFAPWERPEPVVYTDQELAERLGGSPATRERAIELGLLEPLGDGRWRAPVPRLLSAGEELSELGVSLDAALDAVAALLTHLDPIARRFVGLFVDEVWAPFDAAGRPAEGWASVREALERLRPIATEVLLAAFQRAMAEATEQQVAQQIPQLADA